MEPNKKWITIKKDGIKMAKCPYCGDITVYPYDECDKCHHEVDLPDEKKIVKREWW